MSCDAGLSPYSASFLLVMFCAATLSAAPMPPAAPTQAQITVLYDAFGKSSDMHNGDCRPPAERRCDCAGHAEEVSQGRRESVRDDCSPRLWQAAAASRRNGKDERLSDHRSVKIDPLGQNGFAVRAGPTVESNRLTPRL
jgi:hypothetical protein